MKINGKILCLILVTTSLAVTVFCLKRIPQDLSYHDFADKRALLGIPNFMNVVSNLPFLFVGGYGWVLINKGHGANSIKLIYSLLFTGIFLTGIGSGYYHYHPDNNRLIWDRIPMTIIFMAFLAATLTELVNVKLGRILLWPLLFIGVGSVLWWQYTESIGQGDLRIYVLVQFYPVIIIPLLMLLFPSLLFTRARRLIAMVVGWYVIAKVFEHFDRVIYEATGFISGHTLKHLAASVATLYIVRMFHAKYVNSIQPS